MGCKIILSEYSSSFFSFIIPNLGCAFCFGLKGNGSQVFLSYLKTFELFQLFHIRFAIDAKDFSSKPKRKQSKTRETKRKGNKTLRKIYNLLSPFIYYTYLIFTDCVEGIFCYWKIIDRLLFKTV